MAERDEVGMRCVLHNLQAQNMDWLMVKVGGPQHHSKQLRRNSDEDKSCATLLKEPKMIFLLQFLPRIGEECFGFTSLE